MFFRTILYIACQLLILTYSTTSGEAVSPGAFPTSINIKDYGAVGDGVTDDTAAIQAAADKALELETAHREQHKLRAGTYRGLSNGSKASSYPEIYFPKGRYLISRTILFQQSAMLRASGDATIVQKNANQDIFYFHYAYRYAVEGLQFEGGKIQLHFWTGNMAARLRVENCVFKNSASYALECTSYTKEKLEGSEWNKSKPWPPYTVDNNELTPNDANDLKLWYNSTLFMVERSRFDNCMHVANVACDLAAFHDLFIHTNPAMEGTVFHNRGQMRVEKIQGLARVNKKNRQYWFSGDGDFDLKHLVLEADSETGLSVIHSSVVPGPTIRKVRIEDSEIKSAGAPDNAIVYVQQGTMPNIIAVSNVQETSGNPVNAVAWEGTPNLELLNQLKFYKNTPEEEQFHIVIGDNSENIASTLPDIFVTLKKAPVSAAALRDTYVADKKWDGRDVNDPDWTFIYVQEHGVDPSNADDQTAAIQKVFDIASQSTKAMVVFPGSAIYKVSETIRLPEEVAVRVAGVSFFIQTDPAKSFFEAKNAKELIFKNCDFMGGRTAVVIHPDSQGRILFDYCSFFDQHGVAIECLSEKNNQARILVQAGIFRTDQALITNAAHSQMDGFWGITAPHLNETAFIENRGGKMRIRWMLGNPVIWRGKYSKKEITDWNYGNNIRWVDNWGQLYCQGNRFGGESGGMCSVFNRAAEGTVYIGGGFARYRNAEASPTCLVFAEKAPAVTVAQNVSCIPNSTLISYADEQHEGTVHKSGTFAR